MLLLFSNVGASARARAPFLEFSVHHVIATAARAGAVAPTFQPLIPDYRSSILYSIVSKPGSMANVSRINVNGTIYPIEGDEKLTHRVSSEISLISLEPSTVAAKEHAEPVPFSSTDNGAGSASLR